MQRAFHSATSLICGAALFLSGFGVATAQSLPGGASSLNETHDDWRVICAVPEGAVHCTISQTQVSNENRQRVLVIELSAAENGQAASGMLVLPFGLNLDQGAVLSIDEGAFLPPLRFSTCLPVGCLVPLMLNADTVTAMLAGTALKVKAAASDSGQEVNFSILLSGFTSALARAADLGGSGSKTAD